MSMNPGRLGTRAFQKKSRGLDIFWWLHTIPSLKLTCSHLKNDDMETTFPFGFPLFSGFPCSVSFGRDSPNSVFNTWGSYGNGKRPGA